MSATPKGPSADSGVDPGIDLSVDVGGRTFRNPVMTASGTFGYALEYAPFFDVAELGAICTKGLSLLPRAGNEPARIVETASGMLNAIGLANVGVEAFCVEKLPRLRAAGVTVVANIFGTTVEDFVTLARRLDREEGVAALELNVSCPNVSCGGLEFGVDPAACAEVTAAVKRTTRLPGACDSPRHDPQSLRDTRRCSGAPPPA